MSLLFSHESGGGGKHPHRASKLGGGHHTFIHIHLHSYSAPRKRSCDTGNEVWPASNQANDRHGGLATATPRPAGEDLVHHCLHHREGLPGAPADGQGPLPQLPLRAHRRHHCPNLRRFVPLLPGKFLTEKCWCFPSLFLTGYNCRGKLGTEAIKKIEGNCGKFARKSNIRSLHIFAGRDLKKISPPPGELFMMYNLCVYFEHHPIFFTTTKKTQILTFWETH